MSFALDVNVLLYASDQESPLAPLAKRFLEGAVRSPELLCLAWPTLTAYVRLTTNPASCRVPLSTEEATANVTALLAQPRSRVLVEEEGFWDIYRGLLDGHRARHKLVPDVHLAALLRQHGVKTLYTRDRDFRRFDFLDVRDPFAA